MPLVKSNSGSFVEDDISQDYDYADLVDSKVDLKRLERSEAIKRMRANEEEIACQLCGKKLMNRVSETQDKEMLEEIVDFNFADCHHSPASLVSPLRRNHSNNL